MGWEQLKQELDHSGYDPKKHFLFGDKYQTSSILSFYSSGQKRAYFLNLQGTRKNQFSFWPSMAMEQRGHDGFFVLTENSPYLEKNQSQQLASYQKLLEAYFKKVEFMGIKTLFKAEGKIVKGAIIFKCDHYNGRQPEDPQRY